MWGDKVALPADAMFTLLKSPLISQESTTIKAWKSHPKMQNELEHWWCDAYLFEVQVASVVEQGKCTIISFRAPILLYAIAELSLLPETRNTVAT